jgi:hypothetical protein
LRNWTPAVGAPDHACLDDFVEYRRPQFQALKEGLGLWLSRFL